MGPLAQQDKERGREGKTGRQKAKKKPKGEKEKRAVRHGIRDRDGLVVLHMANASLTLFTYMHAQPTQHATKS